MSMTRRTIVTGLAATATTVATASAIIANTTREAEADATPPATATPPSALSRIRAADYVVIFARDLPAMRHFYEVVMGFPLYHALAPQWLEYRVGNTLITLTQKGFVFHDPETPRGAAALQLAFRVKPGEVYACAAELRAAGVRIEMEPTDQPWGHRTVFFRDPDGNIIEIYADL